MRRFPALLTLRCAFALLLAMPFLAGVPAADAARCQYVLGFKALHQKITSVIGACLGDEQHNPANGDAIQQTTRGTLVWRKADNQVAFTDGYFTVLDGPHGLEQRLNSQRFAWEANPDGLPVVPDAPTTANRLRREFAGTSTRRTVSGAVTSTAKAKTHHTSRKSHKRSTAPTKPARR